MDRRETTSPDPQKVSSRGTALVTPESSGPQPVQKTSLVIFGTILDTTWRMFIPVLGLLVLGIWLGDKTGQKPLFMIGGVVIGFALAIALVYQQYRQVTPKGKQ